MSKSKTPKPLAGVKPGDPIWSGGKRWIVSAVLKTVVHAERPGHWSSIRGSWKLDGLSRGEAPAEIETPELLARWRAEQDAAAERARLAAGSAQAHEIARQALAELSRAVGSRPAPFMTLAKACALARFVDQLTRESE